MVASIKSLSWATVNLAAKERRTEMSSKPTSPLLCRMHYTFDGTANRRSNLHPVAKQQAKLTKASLNNYLTWIASQGRDPPRTRFRTVAAFPSPQNQPRRRWVPWRSVSHSLRAACPKLCPDARPGTPSCTSSLPAGRATRWGTATFTESKTKWEIIH